ncbi:MAG: endonuclease/exonuclease/phosphatase family protein [Patescibacteria group bacterium]|nr:endonuclease/exonuclease/phosphatase family protein [Patescibacteria group bacterium]
MLQPTSEFLSSRLRPWGLLTAAGAVGCAATAMGLLGRFWWLLDLMAHFPVHYALGLVVLAIVLLWARRRATAVVFLAFAGVNLAIVSPAYFGKQPAPPAAHLTLRAMLLNVNARQGDVARVEQVVRQWNPDILVLEEVSSRWMPALARLAEAYPHTIIEPRGDNFGICLLSKLPVVKREVVHIGDADVPTILATVDTGTARLHIVATHPLPPIGREYSRWRNEQLEKLPHHIDASQPTLLLGDLNTTPWSHHFRQLIRESGLLDSSRGRGIQGSWPSFVPSPLRIPIDHVLHSPAVAVVSRSIGPSVNSDHRPVIVDFAVIEQRP